jgi:hypothetical protein
LPTDRERPSCKDGTVTEPYQTILTKPFDQRWSVSTDFDLILDHWLGAVFPAIGDLGTLFGQPEGGKAYEVGCEEGEVFLELQSRA